MTDTYNSLFLIFLSFTIISVDDNGIATRCCNKKLKLLFRKTELGMQSLSYVGPCTWNQISIAMLKEKILKLEHNHDNYIFCYYYYFFFLYLII